MAKEKQLLFSAFSIYFQLVLLYLGAVEDTALEMKQYLHLPYCKERLLKGMRKVLLKLKVCISHFTVLQLSFPVRN